jgi:hypothetical protein
MPAAGAKPEGFAPRSAAAPAMAPAAPTAPPRPGPTPAIRPTGSTPAPVPPTAFSEKMSTRPDAAPISAPAVAETPSVAAPQPVWKLILFGVGREIAQTSAATWGQTVRLTKYTGGLFRRRSLRRQVVRSEQTLGERVYEAKVGDIQLRQRIAALDEKIREAEATKAKTRPFKTERQALLQQMGAFALAQRSLPPGLEPDRARARDVHEALSSQETKMQEARVSLPPRGAGNWARVGAGYGVIGCAVFLAFFLASGGAAKNKGGTTPGPVADLSQLDSAFKLMPADAQFAATVLRGKEQVGAIASSRAWAKFTALPGVQQAWKDMQRDLNTFQEKPENKQLLDLALDSLSQEFFLYGAGNSVELVDLFMQLQGPSYMIRVAKAAGQPNMAGPQLVLRVLAEKMDLIKVPDLVLGFKISNRQRAEDQLKRLEKWLNEVGQGPTFTAKPRREQVAGNEFLTLTLEGKMLEPHLAILQAFEQRPGEFDALKKKVLRLKLTVSAGIRENYLLVSIGETNTHLAKLGTGPRLIDREEFKRLAPFANRRLLGITYAGKEINAAASFNKRDIDDIVKSLKEAVPESTPPNTKDRFLKDLDQAARDAKGFLSEPDAVLSFSFRNDRGVESYEYDWTKYPKRDGSQPLTLLQHAGGSPLFVAAARSEGGAEKYQTVAKWLGVGQGYFDELLLPYLPAEGVQMYRAFSGAVLPFLHKLNTITSQTLLPSLDGQYALVFDAKMVSKQWFPQPPQGGKELPMLEPALVVGVKDATGVENAFVDYRTAVNDLLTRVRPPGIPPEVRSPETKKVNSGTLYFYPLPPAGQDQQLVPCAGLSSKVGVLAISQGHAERLLTPTPLKANGGPLADIHRPLVSAIYLDWSGAVDALTPWAEFGSRNAGEEKIKQMKTILDLAKVIRSISGATFAEGAAWVTHTELVLQDR